MAASQIDAPDRPLRRVQRPVPTPGRNELLIRVSACGGCRTDLHVLDGEIAASYPIIPGHEIVGEVLEIGAEVEGFSPGQRVGVPWLGHSCGVCPYCLSDRENLCDHPEFTGAARDGGYATHRSEEHTSELQSLMRISYTVFCLKTKQKHKPQFLNH